MEIKIKKINFVLSLLALYIVPVLLVYTKIIPFKYHILTLLLVTALIIILTIVQKISFKNLGIYSDKLFRYYRPYILFTIIAIVFVSVMAEIIGLEPLDWDSQQLYILWAIPISFAQEFIYRGYLMYKLKTFFRSAWVIILINALLFTFLHLVFKGLLVVLPLAFISGLAFAWMYKKYPNLLLISLSHTFLNFTAVFIYGFFK